MVPYNLAFSQYRRSDMMGFWFAVEELDAYTVQECLEALCIFTLIGKQTVTLVKGTQIKERGAVMCREA